MNDAFNPNPLPSDLQASVFELISHNTHTFTGLLRADGTLLEVNRPALELLGVERGEVVGRPAWQIPAWSPAARPAVEAAVARTGRGEPVRFETEVLGNAGLRSVVDFSVRPVAGPRGDGAFLVAAGRDVTAERAAQAGYEAVLGALSEGGVQQTACNGAAERILEPSRKQMLGLRSTDPSWRTVREDGSPYPGDALLLRVADELRAVVARLSGSPPGTLLRVTASAGVALAEAGTSARKLLRRADRALYGAKRRGKTTFVVADAAG